MTTKTEDSAASWGPAAFLLTSAIGLVGLVALVAAAWPATDALSGARGLIALLGGLALFYAAYDVGRFIGVQEERKARGDRNWLDGQG